MIDIIIDGKTVTAEENQSVLQAAKANGIDIPHLCYHPALKPSGSCKLCGVEVQSRSGSQTVMLSCIMKVKPGLVVKTDTALVKNERVKAFNRLLQMAPYSSRIRSIAEKFHVDVTPPPDGCIRCRLCIRVCNDVIGAGALKMEKTDSGSFVRGEPGRCIGCATCANLCPTDIIRIEDRDNVRTVSIKNEIIGKLPLERCDGCGQMVATATFLNHVDSSTREHPHVKESHHYCSTCVKLMSDKAKTEKDHLSQKALSDRRLP